MTHNCRRIHVTSIRTPTQQAAKNTKLPSQQKLLADQNSNNHPQRLLQSQQGNKDVSIIWVSLSASASAFTAVWENNCITFWFLPYCLCRLQGKGQIQGLLCRLQQISCIAAGVLFSRLPEREMWSENSTTIGGQTWNLFQQVFLLIESAFKTFQICTLHTARRDATGLCASGTRRFCWRWRGK